VLIKREYIEEVFSGERTEKDTRTTVAKKGGLSGQECYSTYVIPASLRDSDRIPSSMECGLLRMRHA
jgi:hypothetical protein